MQIFSNQQHHQHSVTNQHAKDQSTAFNQHAPIPAARQTKALNHGNQTINNNNNNNNNSHRQNNNTEEKRQINTDRKLITKSNDTSAASSAAKFNAKSPPKSKINSTRRQD